MPSPSEETQKTQPCAWADCAEKGIHKAPKSRDNLRDYQYFCDQHIKEFNKSWNYFDGMDSDAIYAFQKDATTGHRPTWRPDDPRKCNPEALEEALYRFMDGESHSFRAQQKASRLPTAQRDALALLDLAHPTTQEEIKKNYKQLAKKFHPDFNKGDKKAEETFKNITVAYRLLQEEYLED